MFICFYVIWQILPSTLPIFLAFGWWDALLVLNINLLIAYFLLFFITMLWPYIGSVLGTITGRFRGGKKEFFVPPEITNDQED
jgi:hypothetical protein